MANPYNRIEQLVRESLGEQLKTCLMPTPIVVAKDGKKFSFDGVSPRKRIIVMIKATGRRRKGKPSKLNLTKQGDLVRDTDLLMAAKRWNRARLAILALSEKRTYKWFMGKTRARRADGRLGSGDSSDDRLFRYTGNVSKSLRSFLP
jgi:hypothetical protein